MDNMVIPLLGIAAAAAATFYAVSFSELSELHICFFFQKSFRDLEDREAADDEEGFKPRMTSREKRAARAAVKTRKAADQQMKKKNKN
ncbi:hypothetical protein Dimus_014377 [Dionaea muscipula]